MNQPWVYMCPPSWTPLPPPSPSHPSGSSQCTSPEHPVSCIEPGLAICFIYDNRHVSMLFSQIIPPLPSPTESKSLFFTSVLIKSQLLWTQTSNHLLCSGTDLMTRAIGRLSHLNSSPLGSSTRCCWFLADRGRRARVLRRCFYAGVLRSPGLQHIRADSLQG